MSWTNVSKPTGTSYTNVNSSGKEGFDDSAVDFDASSTFFDSVSNTAYTSVAKPTNSSYQNIAKPV